MFIIDFSQLTASELKTLAARKLSEPMEDWEKKIWQFIADWFNPFVTHISVFSSGSTGAPRQINHTKEAMLNSAQMTCTALQLQPGCSALLCLPADKVGGMMMIVRSFYNRMVLYCMKPSATPLSQLPADLPIDFAAFTPMQFSELVPDYEISARAEKIKKVLLGGETIQHGLLDAVQDMKNEVYSTFGMTETISHIALRRLNGRYRTRHYTVLQDVEISTNENDQLIIHAPKLDVHHLVTNDIVRILSRIEFTWLGRIDNVINTGGVKVYPERIEEQLLPYFHNIFITSVPDNITGERVALVMEAEQIDESVLEYLNTLLAPMEKLLRPRALLLAHPFVWTNNGKLNRKESLKNVSSTTSL